MEGITFLGQDPRFGHTAPPLAASCTRWLYAECEAQHCKLQILSLDGRIGGALTETLRIGTSHNYSAPGLWAEKSRAWHQFIPGVRRRILASSQTGTMALYILEPKSLVKLHSHPHAQYGYCIDGSGVFRIGAMRWIMRKGDSYYIPPGLTHELRISSKRTVLVEFFTPMREDFLPEVLPADRSMVTVSQSKHNGYKRPPSK